MNTLPGTEAQIRQPKTAVLFGSTGFIGLHFARYLMADAGFTHIVLADTKPPTAHAAHKFILPHLQTGAVRYVACDVRQPVDAAAVSGGLPVDFIANFAAVHREPGHAPHEYFETNLPGAHTVCAFAEAVGCADVLFTSSISPYGPSEVPRTEASIPTPETAYGSSKLAAELIHAAWRDRGGTGDAKECAKAGARRLLVVRPGVVFGPGEGGNVSRMVALLSQRGFFVFAGNEQTRKAGIYVKELCRAMWWLHEHAALRPHGVVIANMTMNPAPTMKDYVDAVQRVAGKKAFVPSIPAWLLMVAARGVQTLAALVGRQTGVNVVRVRKLIRSNNIVPGVLMAEQYPYQFTLDAALADWRQDMPEEW